MEMMKENRHLVLDLGDKIEVEADASMMNEFLDHLPSVEAIYFCPPDQGPASGAGYVFVTTGIYREEIIRSHAVALKKALEEDYEILRQDFVSDPEIQKYYSQCIFTKTKFIYQKIEIPDSEAD